MNLSGRIALFNVIISALGLCYRFERSDIMQMYAIYAVALLIYCINSHPYNLYMISTPGKVSHSFEGIPFFVHRVWLRPIVPPIYCMEDL